MFIPASTWFTGGTDQDLEFDFPRVAPGADPENIRLAYAGASSIRVNDDGNLIVNTEAGPAWFLKPLVYQEIGDRRISRGGELPRSGERRCELFTWGSTTAAGCL